MDVIEPAPLVEPVQESAAAHAARDAADGKKRQKVPYAIKRARANAKMRRALNPKNSITFLNELRPGDLKFRVAPGYNVGPPNQGWIYKATVKVDGQPHSATAKTTHEAKKLACEAALKVIVTEQVNKSKTANGPVPQDRAADGEESDSDSGEEAEGRPEKKKKRTEEDPFPWAGLGAFALNKLYADWKIDVNPRLPAKKIPADANKKHPVMLLNELCPNLTYREATQGDVMNGFLFKASIDHDGQVFEGTGANKKDAKTRAAKALLATFGVIYDGGNF